MLLMPVLPFIITLALLWLANSFLPIFLLFITYLRLNTKMYPTHNTLLAASIILSFSKNFHGLSFALVQCRQESKKRKIMKRKNVNKKRTLHVIMVQRAIIIQYTVTIASGNSLLCALNFCLSNCLCSSVFNP